MSGYPNMRRLSWEISTPSLSTCTRILLIDILGTQVDELFWVAKLFDLKKITDGECKRGGGCDLVLVDIQEDFW